MDELIIKIKEYMSNLDNRKFINKLLSILIISIFLLIIINGLSTRKTDKAITQKPDEKFYNTGDNPDYSSLLEGKLEKILMKLKNVDEVSVMITLEDSNEKIPAKNSSKSHETSDETDAEGGTRKIIKEDENTELLQVGEDVIVLKEIKANVKGVIVIAKGAEDSNVLESIYEAVKTVLGINGNRVQVFPGK